MAIVLVEEDRPARTVRSGADTFTIAAGTRLVVETSPGGGEILDTVVPAGKSWLVTASVYILETAA